MAALTPVLLKLETEGDLQIINAKFSTVRNADTYDASLYFKNVVILTTSSTVAASESSGVVTFTCTSGAPTNVFLRIGGN